MPRIKHKDGGYAERRGLVETSDAEIDRPILRRPGFAGITSLGDMESSLSRAIRARRTERKLTREQIAGMIGLSTQVFGRYEKAVSEMHVTRLFHLCEILDASPVEVIHEVALHLFGDTSQEAETRASAMSASSKLPVSAVAALNALMATMISK